KNLCTSGLGIAIGMLCRILVRLTHSRPKKTYYVLAVIAGLFANYFQWTVLISYLYIGKIPWVPEYLNSLDRIMTPDIFIQIIVWANEIGIWEVAGHTFTGLELVSVWLIEFVIILGFPIWNAHKIVVNPYSESFNKWYPKYTLIKEFESISTVDSFLEDFQENPIETIEKLETGSGSRHSKIHIFFKENEIEQYLKVDRVYVSEGGKRDKTVAPWVPNVVIDAKTAKAILD